ncbi:MAG: 50S ribosomal protein L18 [Candidatus Moranbacteria bacterium RIFCSPHIGHO2_01_FULL_55_24]|nr:MAG: 50S ribosomal protein L18 [Candidatus Moranbacteria bacterium RIFCSPHIGHO2_01_FULL_55_24]
MLKRTERKENRISRKRRVRAKVSGTATCPRIAVFRSLRSLYVQAIDDVQGVTLAQATLAETGKTPKHTQEGAEKVGKMLADRLKAKGIEEGVFDRAGYKYHGKVKALADGLRSQGIKI